jgi:hypothetical protein
MNFLNEDFSGSSETKSLIEDMRQFWLSNFDSQKHSERRGDIDADAEKDSGSSDLPGKAGKMATLFWNTMVLSERSAKNYARNLLAYGVRMGMYAGEFCWPLLVLVGTDFSCAGMGLMIA